jgi:hypothetical protein
MFLSNEMPRKLAIIPTSMEGRQQPKSSVYSWSTGYFPKTCLVFTLY